MERAEKKSQARKVAAALASKNGAPVPAEVLQKGASSQANYRNRPSRGQNRVTYNNEVSRVPGIYNEKAVVEVTTDDVIQSYDFLNLTVHSRTTFLNDQFLEIEKLLKQQLN